VLEKYLSKDVVHEIIKFYYHVYCRSLYDILYDLFVTADIFGSYNDDPIIKYLYSYEKTKNPIYLHQISKLDASGVEFYEMPREICLLRGLVELNMGSCRLDRIPNEISLLQKLIRLSLRTNNLTDLPDEMSSMTKLQTLNLEYNKFQKVPVVLSKMKLIVFLHRNPLKEFPAFLGAELKYPGGYDFRTLSDP